MVNNYVVCLSFSHGEAELVPANEHVINIFCFQFWNEPADALIVTANYFHPSIVIKRHKQLIRIF